MHAGQASLQVCSCCNWARYRLSDKHCVAWVGPLQSAAVAHLHCCVPCAACRLIELCEARLVSELLALAPAAAAAEAPHLLCLADELGLVQLRRAAVTFICQHYKEVQVRSTRQHALGGPGGAGHSVAGVSAPLTTCTQLAQHAPLLCVGVSFSLSRTVLQLV